jgi:hypothetical protein
MKYKMVKNLMFIVVGLLLVISAIMPKGSFSFFNDAEAFPTTTFAVGTCDILITSNSDLKFKLKNAMPGESGKKVIIVHNKGTVPITDLYLDTKLNISKWKEQEAKSFAEQFNISLNDQQFYRGELTVEKLAEYTKDNNSLDISSVLPEDGIEPGEKLKIDWNIIFDKSRYEVQKKFEGKKLPVEFTLNGKCG